MNDFYMSFYQKLSNVKADFFFRVGTTEPHTPEFYPYVFKNTPV